MKEEAGQQGKQRHTCERVREKLSKPTQKPGPFDPKLTRPYLVISATPPVKLGTNLKLEDRPSYSTRHCRWKPTGSSPFQAWETGSKTHTIAVDSIGIWPRHHLTFVPHDSLFNSWPSTVTGSHCFSAGQLLEIHGVIAACGSSPPALLDSALLELSDLSFPDNVD